MKLSAGLRQARVLRKDYAASRWWDGKDAVPAIDNSVATVSWLSITFSFISRFLETILMEHIDPKCSAESELTFISIGSFENVLENEISAENLHLKVILVRQRSILLCHAAMVRANPTSSPSPGSIWPSSTSTITNDHYWCWWKNSRDSWLHPSHL